MNICILLKDEDHYRDLLWVASHLESLMEKGTEDIIDIHVKDYKAKDAFDGDIDSMTSHVKELRGREEYRDYDLLILAVDQKKEDLEEKDQVGEGLHIDLEGKAAIVRNYNGDEGGFFSYWFYILLKVLTIFLAKGKTCDTGNCIRRIDWETSGFCRERVHLCSRCQMELLGEGLSPRVVDRIRRMVERIDELAQLSLIHNERGEGCYGSEVLWLNRKSSLAYLQEKMGFGPRYEEISPQLPYDIWRWWTDDSEYWWLRSISHLVRRSGEVDVFSYLTQKRSRDHYRHQIYVASLGWRLLEIKVNARESMGHYFLNALRAKYDTEGFDPSSLREEHIYHAWSLASLLHDIGYPLAHLIFTYVNIHGNIAFDGKMILDMLGLCRNLSYHIWGDFLNNLSRIPEIKKEEVCLVVARELKELLERCFPLNNCEFCLPLLRHPFLLEFCAQEDDEGKSCIEVFDHGLWSAASIISSLPTEETSFSEVSVDNIILWEALQAVALHNVRRVETFRDLELSSAPLAFLLILCDEVQEWDRCIVKRGRFVRPEIEHISIGPFFLLSGELYYDDLFEVSFHCSESKRLKESDWLYEKFTESKVSLEEILSAWKKPPDFRPGAFRFELTIKI